MSFPDTIPTFVTLVDNVDTVLATHPNDRGTEITNIATALGTNLKNVLPQNYAYGISVTIGTDTDHDLDFATMEMRDDGDAEDLVFSSILTKQFDVTFAAGTNAGGMQSGSTIAADKGYLVYAIGDSTRVKNPDIQAVPQGTAFAYPAGYDIKRLFSFFHTDSSSNILAFVQNDNRWFFNEHQSMASGNVGLATWVSIDTTEWIPSGLSTIGLGTVANPSAGTDVAITNDNTVAEGLGTADSNKIQAGNNAVHLYWEFSIITANTLYWISDSANNNAYLAGFILNLLRS